MVINSHMRNFLKAIIRPSSNQKQMNKTLWAIRVIERGTVTDRDLRIMESLGYKG